MANLSEDAFAALWRAEYRGITQTAYLILGDREEARDLAQEAFALAYQKWDYVSQLERPGAWLQRTTGYLGMAWRRRRRYRVRLRSRLGHTPMRSVENPESDPELVEALRALTPAQRVVVVLRYYADQSIDEVAGALGKRPGTIRALSSQGVARLRALLTAEGGADEFRG